MKILSTHDQRVSWVTLATSAAVLLIILLNMLIPLINQNPGLLEMPYLFPAIRPAGTDFRIGLFYPAKAILSGQDPYASGVFPYPPFAAVFAIPFRLFSVETAYLVQVGLLFMANVAAVLLSVHIAYTVMNARARNSRPGGYSLAISTFWQVLVLTLVSYGFFFSIERGNFDIYAVLFSLLGLWLLIKKPGWLWPQVILISIAAQLKIYPAILFILILWRHSWKSLIPITIVNALLLVVTGPANLAHFISFIFTYSSNPFIFIGNHSAASFAVFVNNFLAKRVGISLPAILFMALPVLIWLAGAYILWKRKYSPMNAVLLFIISVPLMNLIPSTSHDYKLVILSSAVAIFLFIQSADYIHTGHSRHLLLLTALMALMFFLTRSYTMLPVILGNKYPFVLMLEGIFVLSLLKEPSATAETQAIPDNLPA